MHSQQDLVKDTRLPLLYSDDVMSYPLHHHVKALENRNKHEQPPCKDNDVQNPLVDSGRVVVAFPDQQKDFSPFLSQNEHSTKADSLSNREGFANQQQQHINPQFPQQSSAAIVTQNSQSYRRPPQQSENQAFDEEYYDPRMVSEGKTEQDMLNNHYYLWTFDQHRPIFSSSLLPPNLSLDLPASDDRIWEVLEMIEMRDVVAGLPFGLDSQVAEGGSNFSAGQRQLLCFGRAILNNCRVVVMDEATANVDVETDAKIQRTIREQFKEQTVIVVAHRLNTIMDSTRIMVMDQGYLSEFDTPENLKANPESAFNALIQSLDH
ncbi:Multidrug resistance-associated protein [Blattamonas nauphoetae]|uniref:Multidrug resistance-associated protein n=1 Tax=Blattamonas nauphoetae TaxID=2049346 RepID=A0ABQ9Y763_9EUKA|nr:Multidrug resistance-associated protein [Blattamonas nauphoetae]